MKIPIEDVTLVVWQKEIQRMSEITSEPARKEAAEQIVQSMARVMEQGRVRS